jgi:Peptidase C39 family
MRLFILILLALILTACSSAEKKDIDLTAPKTAEKIPKNANSIYSNEGQSKTLPLPDKEKLFKGVIQQNSDYSCGAAALANLINGLVENAHVMEQDVIKHGATEKVKDNGFSLNDLVAISKKLGHKALLRGIPKEEFPKINLPVLLLIGLNNQTAHYVVLKGIRNGVAYLADPVRGNIRVEYSKLIEEGLSQEDPEWYVIAVNPSVNKPKGTNLYLADDQSSLIEDHMTAEQSNAITLLTLPRSNQLFVNYGFSAALGENKNNFATSRVNQYSHALSVRYGITDDIEIGGAVQYSDIDSSITAKNRKIRDNFNDERYSLLATKRFNIDGDGKYSLNTGVSTSYSDRNGIFSAGFNVVGYRATQYGQFFAGGSIAKDFSSNQGLPEFTYSGFIGANKPLGDRFMGSLSFGVNDGESKNNFIEYKRTYSVSTSMNYVLNEHFQLSGSYEHIFGDGYNDVFGLSITYTDGWSNY